MSFDGKGATSGAMTGAATGAMVGSVVPGVGTAIGAGVGLVGGALAGGFMGGDSGPDYSGVTAQYQARNAQIGQFAQQLAASRAKYMMSLNNMYNNAYARFSGNAEAGFAARGLAVNGGAFASTLARETGRMQDEGDVRAAGMERDDYSKIDNAYGSNSSGYMNAISGGPALRYGADRQDSAALGGFAMTLANSYAQNNSSNGNYGSAGGPRGYGVENPSAYPRNSFRGNPLDLRS